MFKRPLMMLSSEDTGMDGQWKSMTFFALSLPNRPGELAHFTAQLRDAGINLIGLWCDEPGVEQTRISCVPESPELFRQFFAGVNIPIEQGTTFYMAGPDEVGALVATLQRIAAAEINIESIETIAAGGRYGCFLWCDQSQIGKLASVLNS
jgi:prephenate dehydratase